MSSTTAKKTCISESSMNSPILERTCLPAVLNIVQANLQNPVVEAVGYRNFHASNPSYYSYPLWSVSWVFYFGVGYETTSLGAVEVRRFFDNFGY